MAEEKPKRRGPSTVAPETEPSVRKGYEAARDPEPQGDGDPGPDTADEKPSPKKTKDSDTNAAR